jgi:hypothetical protein
MDTAMVRNKDQGTHEEVRQEAKMNRAGYEAELLRQRGTNDLADIRAKHPTIGDIYIESKWRERLNIFKTMKQATDKVKDSRRSHGLIVTWWKQTIQKDGNERRSQVFKPLVIMAEDDFMYLLRLAEHAPPPPENSIIDANAEWADEDREMMDELADAGLIHPDAIPEDQEEEE